MKRFWKIGVGNEVTSDIRREGADWIVESDPPRRVRVEPSDKQTTSFLIEEKQDKKEFQTYFDGKIHWVWLDGFVYRLKEISSKQAHHTASAEKEAFVQAPMTGKIIDILLHEGDDVEAGQTLMKMEAMKMEYALAAPISGKVAEIRCNTDQTVDADEVVAKIECGEVDSTVEKSGE